MTAPDLQTVLLHEALQEDETAEERELASHLDTWAPHCGAPRSVYEGQLNKLLEAVRAAAEERGAAREREACAEIAEAKYAEPGWGGDYKTAAAVIADAIRSRSER